MPEPFLTVVPLYNGGFGYAGTPPSSQSPISVPSKSQTTNAPVSDYHIFAPKQQKIVEIIKKIRNNDREKEETETTKEFLKRRKNAEGDKKFLKDCFNVDYNKYCNEYCNNNLLPPLPSPFPPEDNRQNEEKKRNRENTENEYLPTRFDSNIPVVSTSNFISNPIRRLGVTTCEDLKTLRTKLEKENREQQNIPSKDIEITKEAEKFGINKTNINPILRNNRPLPSTSQFLCSDRN